MNVVLGLPPTQNQYDFLCVIMGGLTKFSHFIPVKSTYSTDDYERIFIDDILSPWYSVIHYIG